MEAGARRSIGTYDTESDQVRGLMMSLAFLVSIPAAAQERATAWQGATTGGKTINFDPGRMQRPAILFFWATWCPYCKALMPHVQSVYAEAGRRKLDVYAIDINDDGDPVAVLKERGATFTPILDGDPIAEQYGIRGTPGLLLIDRDGHIAYRRIGGDSPEKVEAELRHQLNLAPAR
jgi:thiol-disulfide isomerase/thioredoxin